MLTFSWDSQVDTAEMTLYQQSGHLVWHPLGLTGLMSLLSKGTLKSLLQHHSLKASVLWCSTLFMVWLFNLCMTTGKAIALTIRILVCKAESLLFSKLSRLVTAFLPRSKHLLISWLQSTAVILEPKKIKSLTVSIVFPFICQKWWDWMRWS